MTWIELGNPIPHSIVHPSAQPTFYQPYVWPAGETRTLGLPAASDGPGLFNVLDGRRSRREFAPLSHSDLSALLWHTARSQGCMTSALGFDLEQRPTPSAGAIHPIHIVVRGPRDNNGWKYDSRAHSLIEIPGSMATLEGLAQHCNQLVPAPEATQVFLIAEPGKTLAKYKDGCSLIWRDAGVILGVMAIVAEGLGLGFCPLGITGEPWAGDLAPKGVLAGVGIALAGTNRAD